MKRKHSKPKVFFNASVILAGLHSPSGGSGKLLALVKEKRIIGIISEIILDEVLRHTKKLGITNATVEKRILALFTPVSVAPRKALVKHYTQIVIDQGDAHVLASTYKSKADFLVTLDKKHLLILQNTIAWVQIVTPKELLEWLSKKKLIDVSP